MGIRPNSQVYANPWGNADVGDGTVVVPTDSAVNDATLPINEGLYVGGAGAVAMVFAGGNGTPVVFTGVTPGTVFRGFRIIRIAATNVSQVAPCSAISERSPAMRTN